MILHNRTLAVAHPLVVAGTRHNCEQAAPVCAPIRVIKETRLQPVQTGWIIPQLLLPQLFLFYWQWGTESQVKRKCGLSVQKYFSVSSVLIICQLFFLSHLPTSFSGSSQCIWIETAFTVDLQCFRQPIIVGHLSLPVAIYRERWWISCLHINPLNSHSLNKNRIRILHFKYYLKRT